MNRKTYRRKTYKRKRYLRKTKKGGRDANGNRSPFNKFKKEKTPSPIIPSHQTIPIPTHLPREFIYEIPHAPRNLNNNFNPLPSNPTNTIRDSQLLLDITDFTGEKTPSPLALPSSLTRNKRRPPG